MERTQYPAGEDLARLLAVMGWSAADHDLSGAVDAAIREFEQRTGRRMLAPAADAERVYDPPQGDEGLLALGADLAVLTSVVYRPEGTAGETLAASVDYWLLEPNAPEEGRPWTAIRLARTWLHPARGSLRGSIRITGRWGYGTTLPADAWSAMLHRAAALLVPQQGYLLTTGRVRTATAGVETTWGQEPLLALRRGWEAEFEAAVARYRRAV